MLLPTSYPPCRATFDLEPRCFDLIKESGILFKDGWADIVLLSIRINIAVCANHCLLVLASAGIPWEDFSAPGKEVCMALSAVTRLKLDCESV